MYFYQQEKKLEFLKNNTQKIAREFAEKIMQEVLNTGTDDQMGKQNEMRRRILPAVDPVIIDSVSGLAKAVQNGITEMVARVAKQIFSDDVGQDETAK